MSEGYIFKTVTTNHPFKYYDIIGMLAIAVMMITIPISPKIVPLGPFHVSAGLILFPLMYLISDVLTEIYGYARARRVTWMMFFCQLLMAVSFQAAIAMPAASFWHGQEAMAATLGSIPRIMVASVSAILVGDFINCFVLSRMKIIMEGRHFWTRSIASTFCGQAVDSLIFYTIAFYGLMPNGALINTLLSCWMLKVLYEVLLLPVTYWVVAKLKHAEGIDHFDYDVDYTPFSLKIKD